MNRYAVKCDECKRVIVRTDDVLESYAGGVCDECSGALDLLGVAEIAALLGVKQRTVHQWRQRKLLPPRDATVSALPAWRRATIITWARQTGRIT